MAPRCSCPADTLDASDIVTVEQAVIDEYLPQQPADGTIVRTDEGERYVFAGAPPSTCHGTGGRRCGPKPSVTTVAQEAPDLAGGLNGWSHVRNVPADGTLIKAGADVYMVQGGVPVPTRVSAVCPSTRPRSPTPAGEWSHLGS